MTQIIHLPYSEYLKKHQYLIGLFILGLASYFNLGFHHPDEHFQILEILNYKTRAHFDSNWLPWDLNDKLRSYFQIFFYWPFEILFHKAGVNPFYRVFFYKFLTASIGFIGLMKYLEQIKFDRRYLMIFFWFVPLFFARTSSESLSMGLFFWGLFSLNKKTNYHYFICGLLFAFSCYARFPMLVAVAFVGLWVALNHERKLSLGFIDLGFIIGVGVGVLIDYWGYGEWTISVWNYFKANIIESKGNQFGVEPFWYFFVKPGLKAGPIGILLTVSVLYYWFRRPKSQLTLWTLGYVLIHSLVSHKEIRFIAPVYLMGPLMFFMMEKEWGDWTKAVQRIFKIFFVVNLFYLFKIAFFPNTGYLTFYKYLYDNPVGEIYNMTEKSGANLKLINRYYLKDNRTKLRTAYPVELDQLVGEFHLLTSQYREVPIAEKHQCQQLFSYYPKWFVDLNPFDFRSRSSLWILWKCP